MSRETTRNDLAPDREQPPAAPETEAAVADGAAPDELERLRAELEATREQLLRKVAEFQNFRRRTEQEKALLLEVGKAHVVTSLLDVVDDFERSLEATRRLEQEKKQSRKAAYEGLKEGVELIYRKLMEVLAQHGVEPIEAAGRPFDEARHEAVLQQPAPEGTPSGVVLQELQKGYRLGDRVLRHAKVVVSS
ncbi:nucleotide exchange factor GrpE [Rhodocaloribacter litoris]|uniref:nucleotide exchange factor GrpE n=1 Tax=Rhodocaloribacter litoris TaxID=2558931 RepID=UPI00141FD294|nr:nucleotide exchange factor GrpE [Rhodocaloribacter litoris]QXD15225.1 nucleotide exchange factor GrpE [Rhodocaloribacter litoris]